MLRVAMGRARPDTEWSANPGLRFTSNLASTTSPTPECEVGSVKNTGSFAASTRSFRSGNQGLNLEEKDLA
jgi:hypothetical protein